MRENFNLNKKRREEAKKKKREKKIAKRLGQKTGLAQSDSQFPAQDIVENSEENPTLG